VGVCQVELVLGMIYYFRVGLWPSRTMECAIIYYGLLI